MSVLEIPAGLLSVLIAALAVVPALEVEEGPERAAEREAARELDNPVAYTSESIRQGRKHYLRLCQDCHGADGRALENFDFEATDLTAIDRYVHGASDGDVFYSIKEGAGLDMPAFSKRLDDEQIWEVVNFIRSIGPDSAKPKRVGEGG
jgi:mono/diheme cytochrome c family protein